MTDERQELARVLNGREYPLRIPDVALKNAEKYGLVIVYGASDDLMEFEGVINDEIGVYNGGTAYLDESGLIENACEDVDCPYFQEKLENAVTIKALWCPEQDILWRYETEISHSTFMVMDNGDKYCQGIVFALADVQGA